MIRCSRLFRVALKAVGIPATPEIIQTCIRSAPPPMAANPIPMKMPLKIHLTKDHVLVLWASCSSLKAMGLLQFKHIGLPSTV